MLKLFNKSKSEKNMTAKEKQTFKQIIDTQIQELSAEIATIRKALYPERGEGPSDKVAHLNFKLDQSIHIQRHEEATNASTDSNMPISR